VGIDAKPPESPARPVKTPVSLGKGAEREGTLVYPLPEEPTHDGPPPDEEPGCYHVIRSGSGG